MHTWRKTMRDAPVPLAAAARSLPRTRSGDDAPEAWPEGKRHVASFHGGSFLAEEDAEGNVLIYRRDAQGGRGDLVATFAPSQLGGYTLEEESDDEHRLYEHSNEDKRLGARDALQTRRGSWDPGQHSDALKEINRRNAEFWRRQS